ncbi:uncharacterized protein LOC123006685 [Tribolium madens]|uniref:uncharacterized protein LOC123006685 n=1 Tax=Tribolium madens TaxID=41895 RepID=UPI001CF741CC|nr:uncharacterized protein LOC123006685 [Tribolium madens]
MILKDSTKMEQKRFGVKISLLNELRLFQSMLKKKKMFYIVDLTSNAGTQSHVRIYTEENIVTIPLPGFALFAVIRQDYRDRGLLMISLVLGGLCEITIKFESEEEKRAFKRDISSDWTPSPEREECE